MTGIQEGVEGQRKLPKYIEVVSEVYYKIYINASPSFEFTRNALVCTALEQTDVSRRFYDHAPRKVQKILDVLVQSHRVIFQQFLEGSNLLRCIYNEPEPPQLFED